MRAVGLLLLTTVACRATHTAPDSALRDEVPAAESPTAPAGFDVNDVSILFPRSGGKPLPNLTLADLLTRELWADVAAQIKKTVATGNSVAPTALEIQENWRIYALRLDPCFPAASAATGAFAAFGVTACDSELRLIASPDGVPMAPDDDPAKLGAEDSAMHLVYRVSGLDLQSGVLADLAALRDACRAGGHPTAGVPLDVHPCLAADPDAASRVATLIRTYAVQSSLARMAVTGVLSLGTNRDTWLFFGGAISGDHFTPADLPNLPGGSKVVQFPGRPPAMVKVNPAPATDLNANPILHAKVTNTDFSDAVNDVVHALNDPGRTDFFHTDCVSCHLALTVDKGHRVRPGRYLPPPGVTGYTLRKNLPRSIWTVRAFGYLHNSPTVAMRTVNETAEVVRQLNQTFGLAAVGRDCTGKEDQVYACMVGDGPGQGDAGCLAACTLPSP